MLQTKRGYRRKYVYGGRGLFDTVSGLLGRVFASSAAKTLGSKAMTAATNAALKGVEKGATKAVDHVVEKITSKRKPRPKSIHDFVQRTPAPSKKMTSQQRTKLNNILGGGIVTIRDVVKRYK